MSIPGILDNFSGGEVRLFPRALGPTQSSRLRNLIHTDGNLHSIGGRVLYNQDPMLPDGVEQAVRSAERVYHSGHRRNDEAATAKQGWSLARCGEYVWLACETEVVLTEAALEGDGHIHIEVEVAKLLPACGTFLVEATTPYQLTWSANYATPGVLSCTVPVGGLPMGTALQMVDFRPILKTPDESGPIQAREMNGRCYIAGGGLHRWDWFYYAVGTLSGDGAGTLTGTGTDWTQVRAGDTVFVGTPSQEPSFAMVYTGPYTVESVTDLDTIVLTDNGPDTNQEECVYIIARVHPAGIAGPEAAPTVEEIALTGGLSAGTYHYKCVYYYLYPYTEFTPIHITEFEAEAGDKVAIEAYLFYSNYLSGYAGVRIYRTKADGAVYYWLADYVIPAGSFNGWLTIYLDAIEDAALTDEYPKDGWEVLPQTAGPNHRESAANDGATGPGTFQWCWGLSNSLTAAKSNPSPPCDAVTITAGHFGRVTADLTGCDMQGDTVWFARTTDGTLTLRDLVEVPWVPGTATVVYDDTATPDSELGQRPSISYEHAPAPAGVARIQPFNGSLYASCDDGLVWRSTCGDPEHWPVREFPIDDPTGYDVTLGCYFRVGDPGDPVISLATDVGAASSSGAVAANLLLQTTSRAWHLSGQTWLDHNLEETWGGGIASGQCAALCNGPLAYIDRQLGPVVKYAEAGLPEPAYGPLFPVWRYPFPEQVSLGGSGDDYFSLCSGVYWRGFYIFTWCQSPSATPNRMGMLHLRTMTYTEIGTDDFPVEAYDLCVWDKRGDNCELYYADAHGGHVWRLFAQTGDPTYWIPAEELGVPAEHKTELLQDAPDAKRFFFKKGCLPITMRFRRPLHDQAIMVSIYADGEEDTPAWTTPVALTIAAEGDGASVDVPVGNPLVKGRSFIIGWSGTFTNEVILEEIGFEIRQYGKNA